MARFIVFYLLIYGLLHAVFFHRITLAFPLRGWLLVLVLGFLLLMILSPMISRMLETRGHDYAARSAAFVGYAWMGFIFFAFLGSLCLYLVDGFSWVSRLIFPGFHVLTHKVLMTGLMGLILGVMGYGAYEALNLRVERLTLQTQRLPGELDRLRIVQISDIHLGIINRDAFLGKVMDRVRQEKPDMLVCTGDLVDGSMTNLMHLSDLIKSVNPDYGKFAVTGNHEYYAGLDHALDFMKKSGFEILRQEAKTVHQVINVVGVDDGGRYSKVQAAETLGKAANGLFTLYLVHRPDLSPESKGLYDLQLCGHTHNGQIFPFNYFVATQFPLLKGFHRLCERSSLYISRGTGTWGPPIRFLSPPEITVIDIIRGDGGP
ncbi:MAG: metallophosphoesterase [Proteobacteria bacterium]|nr:metallophosphoesterase [Pseudomonadota bacterium]